jgi:molecular chaperone GrpE
MQNNDPQSPGEAQPSQPDESSATELEILQARVAELEASNLELREKVLREHAELENQRRRLHRDLDQARRLAVEGGDVASMREGINLTLKSLLKVAENHGMAQINPIGEPLDPERHHAVSMVDAPDHAPGTVVSVLQKGYVLNDRLLRPALVAVAND